MGFPGGLGRVQGAIFPDRPSLVPGRFRKDRSSAGGHFGEFVSTVRTEPVGGKKQRCRLKTAWSRGVWVRDRFPGRSSTYAVEFASQATSAFGTCRRD